MYNGHRFIASRGGGEREVLSIRVIDATSITDTLHQGQQQIMGDDDNAEKNDDKT